MKASLKPEMFQNLSLGGEYTPPECHNPDHVAIIVPYRNRVHNLDVLLHYMHPFLMRQNIHYKIYVINQGDDLEFNKATLLNIGSRRHCVNMTGLALSSTMLIIFLKTTETCTSARTYQNIWLLL